MANPEEMKSINLALQGGGAHGAFTWGVLDRFLEDERLEIAAVTGASAGAMNAAVLADGLSEGSRQNARETLARFWHAVSQAAPPTLFNRTFWDRMRGEWSLDNSPAFLMADLVSRLASPYDLNPLGLNPLRDLVGELVDFERVRACNAVKVFISATDVETGAPCVFDHRDLGVDHVMASACLPFVFKAVEIDGKPYWDGGYMGNPPLWPLFDHSPSDDVVLVRINPFHRQGTPKSARDILDRVNEITFNASLVRELRAVDFVSQLIEDGRLDGTGYRRVLLHHVHDDAFMSELGASSKLNAEQAFFDVLFARGRAAADRWIATNFDALGRRSTLDLDGLFGDQPDPLDGARIRRQARFQSKTP